MGCVQIGAWTHVMAVVAACELSQVVEEAAWGEECISSACALGCWANHDMRDEGEPLQLSSTG